MSPVAEISTNFILPFAYVDPGIVGGLYQMLYVAIFTIAATVIFKPWGFLKAQFFRLTGRRPAPKKDPAAGPARDDDGTS